MPIFADMLFGRAIDFKHINWVDKQLSNLLSVFTLRSLDRQTYKTGFFQIKVGIANFEVNILVLCLRLKQKLKWIKQTG